MSHAQRTSVPAPADLTRRLGSPSEAGKRERFGPARASLRRARGLAASGRVWFCGQYTEDDAIRLLRLWADQPAR